MLTLEGERSYEQACECRDSVGSVACGTDATESGNGVDLVNREIALLIQINIER